MSDRKTRLDSVDIYRDPSINGFCLRNGIGRTKTYEEIGAGRLKVHKVGRRTVIWPEDEAAWRKSVPTAECRQ